MKPTVTLGVVSPGAMGSGLARAWVADGRDVVTTVTGRSRRTCRLAAGLPQVDDLAVLIARSDVVVSVCTPAAAFACAEAVLDASRQQSGRKTILIDLNSIAPETSRTIAALAAESGVDFVDGSVSGGPPPAAVPTKLYLSGPRAEQLVPVLTADGVQVIPIGSEVGAASAVKMTTSTIDKGTCALWIEALVTADRHGVLPVVLQDLGIDDSWQAPSAVAPLRIALAARKSGRYVHEMHEVARTHAAAGRSPALFEAMADVFATVAGSTLGRASPEDVAALLHAETTAGDDRSAYRRLVRLLEDVP